MTLKSRLLAIALAISLSTPAAAATITLSSAGIYDYKVVGSALEPWLNPTHTLSPGAPPLEPWHIGDDQALRGSWWYQFDIYTIPAHPPVPWMPLWIARGACSWNFRDCLGDMENFGLLPDPQVGDILRVTYHGFGTFGVLDGVYRDVRIDIPGVTLSQNPLPASWALLASMLGLGGLFRWAKRWGVGA